ncbi:MAG TPA: hypothetical protein VJG67_01835 [Candidatus Paceibacterota bacterium]
MSIRYLKGRERLLGSVNLQHHALLKNFLEPFYFTPPWKASRDFRAISLTRSSSCLRVITPTTPPLWL